MADSFNHFVSTGPAGGLHEQRPSLASNQESLAASLESLPLDTRNSELETSPTPDVHVEVAFSAAVASLLEGGPRFAGDRAAGQRGVPVLRYSNRRRLLDLASRMGLAPFEANLLIERVRFRAMQGRRGFGDLALGIGNSPESTAERSTVGRRSGSRTRWLLAIALALALDAAALVFLLR